MSVKNRQSDEVLTNQEAAYLYIKERTDVTAKECVEALQFFEKGKQYLRWLTTRGHLRCRKKVINGKLQCVYNAALPYVKPVREKTKVLDTSQQSLLKNATTTYRLIDQRRPVHKPERSRRRTPVSISSGLALFDGY